MLRLCHIHARRKKINIFLYQKHHLLRIATLSDFVVFFRFEVLCCDCVICMLAARTSTDFVTTNNQSCRKCRQAGIPKSPPGILDPDALMIDLCFRIFDPHSEYHNLALDPRNPCQEFVTIFPAASALRIELPSFFISHMRPFKLI